MPTNASITRTASDFAFAFLGHAMLAGIMWMVIASFLATDTCRPMDALALNCPVSE